MKKLNFGCGEDIREDWDNVDIQEDKRLTKSFDFNIFSYPIEDNTYDYIYLNNVLEHLDKPDKVLVELRRICKPNAIIKVIVPYYNNKGASGSMQHKCYFSDHTFKDFVENRKVINKKEEFKIKEMILVPTNIGKFFFKYIREKLSLFIGGLISQVHIELKVIKEK